jgi:2-polyprenyl-3-methyl-5-hydroxy-6-metoxy-1,4-benzoquinol methylase
MIEHTAQNNLEIELHGFDHSEYAIKHADPMVADLIECAGVDGFIFRQRYDVMTCFDILEHLTELQSTDFLLRASRYINHAIIAVIPDDNYPNDMELSHINKRPRSYWDKIFKSQRLEARYRSAENARSRHE